MSCGGSIVANIELIVVHSRSQNHIPKETAAGGDGTLFGGVATPHLAVFQTIMTYLGPRFKLLILDVE
jgi:hypothetical protein